jgi:hypothetical protein
MPTLEVPARLLISKCDLFCDDRRLTALPYHLKSRVSVSDFREFVPALEGTTVKVTNNNVNGLFQLWEDFHFRDLAAQLSQSRESGNFTENVVLLSVQKERILTLEEQMHHTKHEIASLRREISRVHKSFEERFRTEPEPASRRANAVEQSAADVQSKVDNLCKALRKVRV